jgi:hypothetical protein
LPMVPQGGWSRNSSTLCTTASITAHESHRRAFRNGTFLPSGLICASRPRDPDPGAGGAAQARTPSAAPPDAPRTLSTRADGRIGDRDCAAVAGDDMEVTRRAGSNNLDCGDQRAAAGNELAVSLTNIQLAINRHSAGGHTMAARRWFSYPRPGCNRYDRSHFAGGDRGEG